MVFLAPILAIFLLVWAIDAFYYTPKSDEQKHNVYDKNSDKNSSNIESDFKKYFKKNIKN